MLLASETLREGFLHVVADYGRVGGEHALFPVLGPAEDLSFDGGEEILTLFADAIQCVQEIQHDAD